MHGGGFGFLPGRANASAVVAASALLAYDKLAGVSVGYGPTAGGRVVRIIGLGFTGATGVTFGGTAGTSFSVVSDQLIEVTTPAKAAAAVDVVVLHPNGNSTLTGGYEYVAAPSISGASFSLTTDSFNGGGKVDVTSATGIKAGSTLTLGGVAIGFIYGSATAFSFHIPGIAIGSSGAKDLVITSPDGQTGTKTSAVTYTKTSDLAQFDDGATMDAAAVVNGTYEFIGHTTRARIALLRCMSTGPVTYAALGPIDFYQADGETSGGKVNEFTGVIAFRALGTGTVPNWAGSVGGNAATGGPKLAGAGTCVLDGLALFGSGRVSLDMMGYLVTRPAATTNFAICAALVRASDETLGCYGGLGKSGTGWANCANADAAVNSFTPSFNSNYSAQPDTGEQWGLGVSLNAYNGAPAAGVQVSGSGYNVGQSALQGAVNDATSGFAWATNLRIGLYISGDWEYRVRSISYH